MDIVWHKNEHGREGMVAEVGEDTEVRALWRAVGMGKWSVLQAVAPESGMGLSGSISPAQQPLTHLRNQDDIRLLDKPGRFIISIGDQDHDFFCHLRRGRSEGSKTFSGIKEWWPLRSQRMFLLSFFLPPPLLSSFFCSFMQQVLRSNHLVPSIEF
jgi:hypothetical protein